MRIVFIKSTTKNGMWMLNFSDPEDSISSTVYLTDNGIKGLIKMFKKEGFK